MRDVGKKMGFGKSLGIMVGSSLVVSSMGLTALAQGRGGFDSVQGLVRSESPLPFNGIQLPAGLMNEIQYVSPAIGMGANAPVLESLVGSTIKALDWPQLPRVFWKFDKYTNETINHYAGLQYGMQRLTGTVKHNISFKYNRSTGLILVGSLRPNDRRLSPTEEAAMFAKGIMGAEPMVKDDFTSGLLYPNVRKGYPLVGMCVFEVSIARESSNFLGIDFFGSGHNKENIEGFGTPFTLFSNFFQLDADKLVIGDYIEDVCQRKFSAGVKDWVETQFFNFHRAYRTEKESTCFRERAGANGDRRPEGDRACMAWHRQLPENVRARSVPRCIRQDDDLFHCTAVNTSIGARCPFTQAGNSKLMASLSVNDFVELSLPCDPARGLYCQSTWPASVMKAYEDNQMMLDWGTMSQLGRCQRP